MASALQQKAVCLSHFANPMYSRPVWQPLHELCVAQDLSQHLQQFLQHVKTVLHNYVDHTCKLFKAACRAVKSLDPCCGPLPECLLVICNCICQAQRMLPNNTLSQHMTYHRPMTSGSKCKRLNLSLYLFIKLAECVLPQGCVSCCCVMQMSCQMGQAIHC